MRWFFWRDTLHKSHFLSIRPLKRLAITVGAVVLLIAFLGIWLGFFVGSAWTLDHVPALQLLLYRVLQWIVRIGGASIFYGAVQGDMPDAGDSFASRLVTYGRALSWAAVTSAFLAVGMGAEYDPQTEETFYREILSHVRYTAFVESFLVTGWLAIHALWRRAALEGIGCWLVVAGILVLVRHPAFWWEILVMTGTTFWMRHFIRKIGKPRSNIGSG